jgi:hypothetical protein
MLCCAAGPLASMNELGSIHDPTFCSYDGIVTAQRTAMGREGGIFEARGAVCSVSFLLCLYYAENFAT